MIFDNFELYNVFGWMFSLTRFYQVGLGIGLLGFIQIIINVLLTLFVETNWIKLMQIIEPLFADIFAIFIVFLYNAPIELSYYLGIAQITIACIFAEFSIYLNKFDKYI